MRVRADAFEHVALRFFEAAAIPEVWPSALHELAQACGAEGAACNAVDGLETRRTFASEALGGLREGFEKRWRAPELNSHRARGMALIHRGWRGVLTEQDCFAPEELARDPFQQEFFMRAGFSSFAGAILTRAPGLALSISINRRSAQGPYTRDEIASVNRLVTHLHAAGEVAVRIGMDSTRRIGEALGTVGHPIALLGHDGRVRHMNAPLEKLMGGGICLKGGRLGSWLANADQALSAAISRAVDYDGSLDGPSASVVLPRLEGARPLLAHVIPVVGLAQDVFHLIAAIVTVTDLEAAAASPGEGVLQQAFGLTPAEARLAAQIAVGKEIPVIAQSDGLSRETLRSQLKIIFHKTGTGRQAELVLLLSKVANRQF